MSDSVPVKVMLASEVPSPPLKVRPVSVLSVSAPWVEDRVTEYRPVGARVASTSAIDRPVIATELSSATVAVAGALELTGSLTAVMVSESATVPELYWVVPPVPVVVRLTVVLLVIAVESSIRCAVSDGVVPFQFAAGRKRTEVVAAKTSALLSETVVEMSVQLAPLNHCQVPSVAVAALAEIAMPAKPLAFEPPETVSVASEKWLANSELTLAPAGAAASSLIAARVVVVPTTVGASLTAVTVSESATVPELYWVVVPVLVVVRLTVVLLVIAVESSIRCAVSDGVVPFQFAAGRKRTEVVAAKTSALLSETVVEMSVQLAPLNHCQVPSVAVAALAEIAMPAKPLAVEPPETVSVASEKWLANSELTLAPAGAAASSLIAARVVVVPTTVGASLTAVTVSESATVPELYWVVVPVPVVVRLTVVLLVIAVESSIRCAVSDGVVPFQFAAGRKRTEVVAAKTSALLSETVVEMSVQLAPLNHCQVPSVAVAALAEIAMPAKPLAFEPPETVSVASEKWLANSELTLAPAGAAASSLIAARVVVVPTTVGASLTAVTVSESATVPELYWVVVPVPVVVRLTVVLLVIAVESSIRCAVSDGVVPFQFAAGRKRTEVVAAKTSALLSETVVEMSVQLAPLNHCQVPSVAVAALAEIAMPAKPLAVEPPETVSVASEKWLANSELTLAPAGAAASSLIAARVVVVPTTVGASLTAVTVSESATVPELYWVVVPVPVVVRLTVVLLVIAVESSIR